MPHICSNCSTETHKNYGDLVQILCRDCNLKIKFSQMEKECEEKAYAEEQGQTPWGTILGVLSLILAVAKLILSFSN